MPLGFAPFHCGPTIRKSPASLPVVRLPMFRFYGPEKPLFDKTWKLPDIEEIR
jgi:hypothetical protein